MITMLALTRQYRLWICAWMAALVSTACAFAAQTSAPRIHSEVSSSEMSALRGSLHPLAQLQYDRGRMPAETRLKGVTVVFNRSAAQESDLQALLAAQQDPSSPLYHKWLTPEQFANRFGMPQADLNRVQEWLQQQGFSIDSVARSRTFIKFSGTAGQVENAFQTQMHYFDVRGERHFAPATELSVPTAMAPTVAAITNLSDFRPHSQHIPRKAFTSGQTGNNFFAPGDINTAYDMKPLLTAGNNGTGQTIVIAGQSYISVSDIEAFQTAAGLTKKDPNLILVPGSGDGATPSPGDEGESDLDLEWSSAMAPGATIDFVYVGSDQSYSVFDSMQFAVDTDLGNIISVSYGVCETELGSAQAALEAVMQQGAAQGQTIVAASGDEGSTACFVSPTTTNPTLVTQEALAVNYPASSQYVTGIGGTEISAANDLNSASTYWDTETSGTDIINSVKTYIPEIAWNDEAFLIANQASGLSASGGGASALFAKPSWQTGVPGIPSDSKRDVPDISFYSSPSFAGYLYCTSDQSDWAQGQTGSCGSGFRASTSDTTLTVAGGTSFATPIFAGMLADLNQKAGYTTGQGNINQMLYHLASNSSTYASVFHDVTSGSNECVAGTTYCSSSSGSESNYSAGTGYDLVTGLGSVDLNALANAWTNSTSTAVATTTTVSASSTSPALNASDTFTVTVTPASGTTAPTGTLTVIVDDGTPVTGIALSASGSSAVGTYQTSFSSAGGHSIVAQFVPSGSTFAASSGGITVTVPGSSSGKGTITVAGTDVTVKQGSSANSTVTVTPASGYTGTVYLTFDTSNDSALANLCYNFTDTLNNGDGSVTVSGTTAVTTQLMFDTNAADCATGAVSKGTGRAMHRLGPVKTAKNSRPAGPNPAPMGIALGGLLLAGFLGRFARKFRAVAGLVALLAIGLAISACGGGGSSSGGGGGTVSNPPKGTYTITLTGTDSVTSSITANSQFKLTIQ